MKRKAASRKMKLQQRRMFPRKRNWMIKRKASNLVNQRPRRKNRKDQLAKRMTNLLPEVGREIGIGEANEVDREIRIGEASVDVHPLVIEAHLIVADGRQNAVTEVEVVTLEGETITVDRVVGGIATMVVAGKILQEVVVWMIAQARGGVLGEGVVISTAVQLLSGRSVEVLPTENVTVKSELDRNPQTKQSHETRSIQTGP